MIPATSPRGEAGRMEFEKWQALGNDYLIVEAASLPFALTPGAVRRLCSRHFGPGADGLLVLHPPDEPGYCKVAVRHEVRGCDGGAEIESEVRIWCTDRRAQLRFRPYWAFIGPFSRFIGLEVLSAATRRAERTSRAAD